MTTQRISPNLKLMLDKVGAWKILFNAIWFGLNKRKTEETMASCYIHYNCYRKASAFSFSTTLNFKVAIASKYQSGKMSGNLKANF